MICTSCERVMGATAKDPVCLTCRSSRTCGGCDKPISWRSKGMCRACDNQAKAKDPAYRELMKVRMTAFNQAPERATIRKAGGIKGKATRAANPEIVNKMRESGRRVGARNIETTRSAESRAKAGRTISEVARVKRAARMAWCPPDRHDEFYRIGAMYGRAEARRIIEADMSAFDKQLAKVRMGAALVDTFRVPDRVVTQTLGGVSSGLL
jgi:hypothetical protein